MPGLFHPALAFALLALSATAASADGPTYQVDTVAGIDWGQDGIATQEILMQAEGIAADANGNLYVADALENRVRKVTPGGMMTTVVGTGVQGFSGDGGPANASQLSSPYGVTFDGVGNLYIADLGNARIRRVTPDGMIATVASSPLIAPRNALSRTVTGASTFPTSAEQRVYPARNRRIFDHRGGNRSSWIFA